MRQLIQSASDTQPIVTMIEDLHWLDAASDEFLEQMIESENGGPGLDDEAVVDAYLALVRDGLARRREQDHEASDEPHS